MTSVAMGIDVGTGSTKVGLVGADGSLLAVGRAPHTIGEPRPGWSETDPEVWVGALTEAIGQALAAADGPQEIVAVGFSGQMHGVVVCDEAIEPLRPAVLWSDQRSQPYLNDLRATADAAGQPGRANPIVAGMAATTMAALTDQEPEIVDRTASILQAKDWVRHRLTGIVATDASDASATLLWDPQADGWSRHACDLYGVDAAWLPPVARSNELAGSVTAAAGASLGLAEGTPVAVGAADTAAALLGAGIGIGETQVSTGTGGQIASLLSSPTIDDTTRTHLYRAADYGQDPGNGSASRWYAMAAIQNAGIAIDWALGLLNMDIDRAGQAVQNSPIGSNGITFSPYLTGERTPHLDSSLTGLWTGLRPGTDVSDLVRSVFEGVAFAMRDGLDALGAAGHSIDQALLAGGGSVAPWWRQMLADVLDIALIPHDAADASVRGAGLLAWAAIGEAIDPERAVNRLEPIEPGSSGSAYAEALARFRAAAATQTGGLDRPY